MFVAWIYRLWHQLTKKLSEFFEHPLARPYRVDTFERFVRDFEGKINQLRLVEMGTKVSKDIDSMFIFLDLIHRLTTRCFVRPASAS